MKIDIGIRWQLMIVCILLVTVPTLIIGILSYDTFKTESYSNTEKELKVITTDWKEMTQSYVDQMNRVLKREEFLVEQRLGSISQDVNTMIDLNYNGGAGGSNESQEALYESISNIKIGRSGYVYVLDDQGRYVVSKGRQYDGEYAAQSKECSNPTIFKDIISRAKTLQQNDTATFSYACLEGERSEPRMKLTVVSYNRKAHLVVAATTYYTDFRSDGLQRVLQDELKYKMANQRIGENGYIWVINSQGDYIVSKDRLRDGENILEVKDSDGRFIIREIISEMLNETPGDDHIRYYSWKNIGEDAPSQKVSYFAYVPEWDWVIGSSAYEKDFLKGLDTIEAHILQTSVAAIILGSIIAYLFASLISRPIRRLEKISVDAASGKLDVSVDQQLQENMGEVGSLARSFNVMIVNLKNRILDVEASRTELLAANDAMEKTQRQLEDFNKKLEERVKLRTRELESEKNKVQELLEQKRQFINQLSHDLRTPLTPLVSMLPLLAPKVSDPDGFDMIRIIMNNVNYITNLVNKTLNLSHLEAGVAQFEIVPVDVRAIVEEVLADSSKTLSDAGLNPINEIPQGLVVAADMLRVREVLVNLISNAAKYCPNSGALTFTAQRRERHAEISVRDRGIGLTEDQLKQLFTEFYRADESRHDLSSGLGLAICRRIIEHHGGKIWAESPGLGKGSTFKFTLLLKDGGI